MSLSSIAKFFGTSGITATVAVLECILPAFSVSGTLCTLKLDTLFTLKMLTCVHLIHV
jgi:hypothetical protein